MMTKVRSGLGSFILALLMAAVSVSQCQADESLVLQGPVPNILFDDNSGLTYQWRIIAESFAFDLKNVTTNVRPMSILAGAPHNSFNIGPDGVGFGTGEPERHLHVFTSANPTLRFEQDDTESAAYTWDVGGNEANFYVIDVTNGDKVPFIIRPGAPTSSFEIASTGNIGFGTTNPTAPIHVKKASQSLLAETLALFAISDDSIGRLEIRNGSATDGIFHPRLRGTTAAQAVPLTFEGLITTDSGSNPVVAYDAARRSGGAVVTRPLVVYRNNGVAKATIAANGVVTATSFNPVSSRALKHDISDLDSQEAARALHQLAPVKFIYKDDESNQKRLGFIAEDVPEVVAAPDRQSVPIMDVVALVTRIVKDQQQTIDEQTMHIEEQRKVNVEQRRLNDLLMKRLNELESQASAKK